MAPNLKRNQVILQTVSGLGPVNVTAFPPLTSDATPFQKQDSAQTNKNKNNGVPNTIIVPSSRPQNDDYWTWSTESDEEMNKIIQEEECFSTDRMVGRMVQQREIARGNSLVAANDRYWDWSPAIESPSYWDWPAAKDEQREMLRQEESAESSYWSW